MQISEAKIKRFLPGIVFFLFGLVGVILIISYSPWGIGVTHDSAFYLSSASNLTEGDGLSWIGDKGRLRPLTHFPPFYPILLAPFIALGIDPEVVALGLAALSFGLIASITGHLVYLLTRELAIGVVVSALVLISPPIIGVHTIALSEPVFLVLTLVLILALSKYLMDPRWTNFLLISILAALGYLTRYVGITLIFTGVVAIVLFSQKELRMRLRDAILFSIVAFIPMAFWMLRNYSLTGTMTNRTLNFHPPTGDSILRFLDTLNSWIVPNEFSFRYQVVGLILASLLFLYLLSRLWKSLGNDERQVKSFVGSTTAFLIIYLTSLAFSITFVDASTPLDNRILSPAYLAGFIVLTLVLSFIIRRSNNKAILIPIVIFAGVLVWNNLAGSRETLGNLKENGIGFTAKSWKESETISWLSTQSEDALIYTNERFAITYITGRPAFSIPEKVNTVTAEVRPEFEQALATMHERLETPNSFLLLFHPHGLRFGMPTRDEITFPLSRLDEFTDALIYIDPINHK
jgi:hypothetical protein